MHNLNKLFHQIKMYFIFHPQDKNGIIALLVICSALVLAPEVYYFFKVEKDYTAIQQQKIDQFIAWHNKVDSINATLAKTNKNQGYRNAYNGDFEPTEKNAAISKDYEYNKTTPSKPLDINTASASDFKLLKGIGAVFSERIVKYRDSKEGFNNIEELKKVYGISDSLYTALLPRLTISEKSKSKMLNTNTDDALKFETTKTERDKPIEPNQPTVKIDINTATTEELKTLKGIGKVLSARIVKYRDSKGGFQNMEELNDVYGIEDSLYFALANRIEMSKPAKSVTENSSFTKNTDDHLQTFASTGNSSIVADAADETFRAATITPKPSKAKESIALNININKATREELMQLNGIGEFRANAIVEHRSKLGGFYQLKQVAEAYSMNDSLYQSILPALTLGEPTIRKININKVTFKALLKHPYIDYDLTKHLINFRDQRKRLKNIEELKASYLIDDELYEKLVVYLTVE